MQTYILEKTLFIQLAEKESRQPLLTSSKNIYPVSWILPASIRKPNIQEFLPIISLKIITTLTFTYNQQQGILCI